LETNLEDLKVQRTFSVRLLVHERAKDFKNLHKKFDISEVYDLGAEMFMDKYEKEHK
jgi:hypothetical protein